MPACKGDLVNCGKYIKQIEAQPWELAVVFIMMAAAIIFVIHFVFFTGGSSDDAKPKPEKKPVTQVPAPKPAPKPKPKEFADKAVQAVNEEDQVFMARQMISAQRPRSASINKSRQSSPRQGLSPMAIRNKGTSSAFNKILTISKGARRTITRK